MQGMKKAWLLFGEGREAVQARSNGRTAGTLL